VPAAAPLPASWTALVLAFIGAGAACLPLPPAPVPNRDDPPCEQIALVARPGRHRTDSLDLVIAVNGATCHREPYAPGASELAARLEPLCGLHFEPGVNRVEVALVRRRSCDRPIARAEQSCVGPEPD
jgi:hypothetical protein